MSRKVWGSVVKGVLFYTCRACKFVFTNRSGSAVG